MTHARFPGLSVRPPAPATFTAAPAPDPVLSAIDAHDEAWAVYQVAPAGRPAEVAEDGLGAALEDLLATPCLTRLGALALVRHLRWLIREEAIADGGTDLLGRLVLTREADLSRFVGSDLPPEHLPHAAPLGRLAARPVRRMPPSSPSSPAPTVPATGRARRLATAAATSGEALAALLIVAGGAVLTGLATLL